MKIDLAEISDIVAEIILSYDDAVANNEVLAESSWGYETGQIFSHDAAKKIADALEQLPKLVEALRVAVEIAAPVDANEVKQLDFAKQALEPFTNQPQGATNE